MDKFSASPVAMKAADRLASLKDVEAVESASSAAERQPNALLKPVAARVTPAGTRPIP